MYTYQVSSLWVMGKSVNMLQNAVEGDCLYFLEHNSYKNCSIDMTFYKDKLEQLDCVHTKFQFSRSSGTSLVCCRIL